VKNVVKLSHYYENLNPNPHYCFPGRGFSLPADFKWKKCQIFRTVRLFPPQCLFLHWLRVNCGDAVSFCEQLQLELLDLLVHLIRGMRGCFLLTWLCSALLFLIRMIFEEFEVVRN
jgi:hypothetical protein